MPIPTVVAAIQRQTAILATHTRYLHDNILEYAEQLTARLPAHLECLHFREFRQRGERCGVANGADGHRPSRRPGHGARLSRHHGCGGGTHAERGSSLGTRSVATLAPPPAGLRVGDELTLAAD